MAQHSPQCHITRRKLPCPLQSQTQCPLEDAGLISDLAFYLYGSSRGLYCIMGKFRDILEPIQRTRTDVEAIDISMLFPDHEWADRIHMYFSVGVCYVDKDFCGQLRAAHRRWYKNLSPPGYEWRGETIRGG